MPYHLVTMTPRLPENFFSGSAPIALVAGGSGFVGSHLCEYLISKNTKVICVDNLSSGPRGFLRHLKDSDKFFFLKHDITTLLPSSLPTVNYLFHLAGVEAYLNGEDLSIQTMEANSIGTRNLLEFSKNSNSKFVLASTIDVFAGAISKDSLTEYFGSSRAAEGEYSHHEAKRFAEAIVSEYVTKEKLDGRVARLGDVYGPRMMLSRGGPVASFIRNAVYKEDILIPPGATELHLYPVYVTDVVEGLIKCLFTSGTKGKIFSLAGPPTTIHHFGEVVASTTRGQSELKYGQGSLSFKRKFSGDILTAGRQILPWEPQVSLPEGARKTLEWFESEKEKLPKEDKEGEQEAEKEEQTFDKGFWEKAVSREGEQGLEISFPKIPGVKIGKVKLPLFLGGLIILLLLIPYLLTGVGLVYLKEGKESLLLGSPQKAKGYFSAAAPWFSLSKTFFLKWKLVPVLGRSVEELVFKTGVLEEVSEVGVSAASSAIVGQEFFGRVLGDEPYSIEETSVELRSELDNLNRKLAFLEADIKSLNGQTIKLPGLPPVSTSQTLTLASLREGIEAASILISRAPVLLGSKAPQRYLVLFQNNMELRPTGGFIGSFALVTFSKGRLANTEVFDVYTADGQLKGHVEPPRPMVDHLGEANWYLRDSNWDPDFPRSAVRAEWFLDKELGTKTEGVIGVDLEFAKGVVEYLGEIELLDFGETINSDNFYEKTQSSVELGFFPGSQRKKDFLTALSKALIFEITNNKDKQLLPLAKTALSALEKRHMSIYLHDEQAAAALAEHEWDGGIKRVSCPKELGSCIADYLMAVEANLGVNKVNYFMERTYSLENILQEKKLIHQLTISYKNNSVGNSWPGGDYKNYLRVYVSQGSEFKDFEVVNPETGQKEVVRPDISSDFGKEIAGGLIIVPPGESRQVVIVWETPVNLLTNGEYVFYWQKQQGLPDETPTWVKLNAPSEVGGQCCFALNVASGLEPSLTENGALGYNTTLSTDLFFRTQWTGNR